MKKLELKEATASLAEYASAIKQEPILVLLDGKPIAALVAIENTDLETVSLSTHPQFLEIIERSRKRQDQEGGISSYEMRKRLGLT